MKILTDSSECNSCKRRFVWKYRLLDFNENKGLFFSEVFDVASEPGIAFCERNIEVPNESEYLTGYCPHCGAPFAIPCSDDILKEFYR